MDTPQDTQPTLNRPLIERLLDRVKRKPEQFDMDSFWTLPMGVQMNFTLGELKAMDKRGEIQTGCLLGLALLIDDVHLALNSYPVRATWFHSSHPFDPFVAVRKVVGLTSAEDVAAEIFQLPDEVVNVLLFTSYWPREYVEGFTQWEAGVAILERILADGDADFLLTGTPRGDALFRMPELPDDCSNVDDEEDAEDEYNAHRDRQGTYRETFGEE